MLWQYKLEDSVEDMMVDSLVSLFNLVVMVVTIGIFLRILFSWINVSPYQNEFAGLVYRLTDPIINPIRRVVPPVGGLDFSPMIALFLLRFAAQIIVSLLYSIIRF
jgi:YggT family protein